MKKLFTILTVLTLAVAPVLTLGAGSVYAQSDSDFEWDWETDTSSTDDGALAGMSLIFWCCCFAVMMLIPLALAFFVYKDAQKSGTESPIMWALLTFFFGLIGLLLYFLVGKKKS